MSIIEASPSLHDINYAGAGSNSINLPPDSPFPENGDRELVEYTIDLEEDAEKKAKKQKKGSSIHQRFESLSAQTRLSVQNQARELQLYLQKGAEAKENATVWWNKLKARIEFDPNNFTLIYLLILGFASASVGFLMDIAIDGLQKGHIALTQLVESVGGQYLIWQGFILFFVMFALFFTKYVSIYAAGSGIPEMKSILSGNNLPQYLTIRTLIAKVVGLVSLVGCGMVVGKEGPFVHTSSIIATYLAKLKPFRAIKNNLALKQQMLAAACGAGVASNFGAPVGGVLFSIEVTSTYYPVRNYYYVFLAATSGGLIFRFFMAMYSNDVLRSADTIPTDFSNSINFKAVEIFIFLVIGAIGGVLGVVFVRVNMFIFKLKSAYNTHPKLGRYFQNNLLYTFVLCMFTGIFTYPGFFGDFMGLGATKSMRDLVIADTFRNNTSPIAREWDQGSVVSNLFTFFTIKFVLCLFAISLPIPLGMYTPLLMLGAGLGRFVGESLSYSSYFEHAIIGGYAVVGAAAMAAGATQTLSTMVIIFEVTGQLTHIAPVMLATMVAYFISKKFTVSIYDAILLYRGLPYLPDLKHVNYKQTAKDLMQPKVKWLALNGRYTITSLYFLTQDETIISLGIVPVVANESGQIVGYIQLMALSAAISNHEKGEDTGDISVQVKENGENSGSISVEVKGTNQLCMDFGNSGIESFDIYFPSILVTENTPFTEIHMLFINLRLQFVLVTNNSKLVGVVTRDGMLGILLENV